MEADENRRIFEYFVIAGLGEQAEELSPGAAECGRRAQPTAPITDICIIFPQLGETVPDGFECIETTPGGLAADLNHGSLRSPSCFLCYRRGHHKPPLVDIGVLYEGKGERVMVDSQMVQTTPCGRLANVNNATQGIFLTYRRAAESAPPNQLAVTELCVIVASKGEHAPHTFCQVNKNLNKGMVGSDVYLCYKKSQAVGNRLAYKPMALDRFPRVNEPDFPLPEAVPQFCLPMGALIECWPAKCQTPGRLFSTFVLTDEKGRRYYGACVVFYERLADTQLTELQLKQLGLDTDTQSKVGGCCADTGSTNDPAELMTFHVNKSICLVSRYPFFTSFRRFLFHLHRMTVTGSYPIPIERYISHLMYEVPFPCVRRPRVLMQVKHYPSYMLEDERETISFDNYDDAQLPLSGAAYFEFLKALGPDNCVYVLLLALVEQKIVVHSLRPWMLTGVAEAIRSLMFPFSWQCPYIPQCPLEMADVLHAPVPFIVGVDSHYFEVYDDPPNEVTLIDLDTATINQSSARKSVRLSMLPKKAQKLLRNTLTALHRRLQQEEFTVSTMRRSTDFIPVEVDYQMHRRRRLLDMQIQEAFLRFIASLMYDYAAYLKPIGRMPGEGATDTSQLFNVDAFVRSRERGTADFYRAFVSTQCFSRFIEDRSLLTEHNTKLLFFDECMAKVDITNDRLEQVQPLLCVESSVPASETTVFITPPDPPRLGADQTQAQEGAGSEAVIEQSYKYSGMPNTLYEPYFALDQLRAADSKIRHRETELGMVGGEWTAATAVGRRTKQEVTHCQTMASVARLHPLQWAKCMLSYSYSLWFMQLPALVPQSPHNAKRTLKFAQIVLLERMRGARLPVLDEMCYRVLIQVAGECAQPLIAVSVFMALRRANIQPNAVTYGIYHRAVLEAEWPSVDALKAERTWTKLRHTIRAIAQMRLLQQRATRERAVSSVSGIGTPAHTRTAQFNTAHSRTASDGLVALTGTQRIGIAHGQSNGNGSGLLGTVEDGGYHSQSTVHSLSTATGTGTVLTHMHSTTQAQHGHGHEIVGADDSLLMNDSVFEHTQDIHTDIVDVEPVDADIDTDIVHVGSDIVVGDRDTDIVHVGSDIVHGDRDTDSLDLDTELPAAVCVTPAHSPSVSVCAAVTRGTGSSLSAGSSSTAKARSPVKLMATKLCESSDPLSMLMQDNQSVTSTDIDTTDHVPVSTDTTTPASHNHTHRINQLQQHTPFDNQQFKESEALLLNECSSAESVQSNTPTMWGRQARGWLANRWTSLSPSTNTALTISRSSTVDLSNTSLTGTATADGADTAATPNTNPLPMSPSFGALVSHARNKMTDAVSKQQPNIGRLRSSVTSMIKHIKVDQLSTPLRGSLSSLAELNPGSSYQDSQDQMNEENEGCLDGEDESALFALSLGQTGSVGAFDLWLRTPGTNQSISEWREVVLCTVSRCAHCSSLCYDEELMAGWAADESNLNTICAHCDHCLVPTLTVTARVHRIKDADRTTTASMPRGASESWYLPENRVVPDPYSSKHSPHAHRPQTHTTRYEQGVVGSSDNLSTTGTPAQHTPFTHNGNDNTHTDTERVASASASNTECESSNLPATPKTGTANRAERVGHSNRRLFVAGSAPEALVDLEALELQEKQPSPNTYPSVVHEHSLSEPLLSPLVLRKELESVLGADERALYQCSFAQLHPTLYWNLLYYYRRLCVPSHLVGWLLDDSLPELWTCNTTDTDSQCTVLPENRRILVRCVYDIAAVHSEQCMQPLYETALSNVTVCTTTDGTDSAGPPPVPVTPISSTKLLVWGERVASGTVLEKMQQQLLQGNIYQTLQLLINEYHKRARQPLPVASTLPVHQSMYRDLLFLAMYTFGRALRREQFDTEFANAFARLPPAVQRVLPCADRAPRAVHAAARRLYMPLDLC